MSVPVAIGTAELAFRVAFRNGPGDWQVVTAPAADVKHVATRLIEALERGEEARAKLIEAPAYVAALPKLLAAAAGEIVVLEGVEQWRDVDLVRLDTLRSRLARTKSTVLVMTNADWRRLEKSAPNFASWVSSVWQINEDADVLDASQRAARLVALRGRYGLTDDDVVSQARSGELPADPEFAEWLVLLGHGDLVPH